MRVDIIGFIRYDDSRKITELFFEKRRFFMRVGVVENEAGFSAFEILFAVALLGMSFMWLSSFMLQNADMIEMNQKKEEAIQVREDLKEWLNYRGQTQDVVGLNPYVLLSLSAADQTALQPEQVERRAHLIIDNSGIQKNSSNVSLYGEVPIEGTNERGKIIRKLEYDFTGNHLPDTLKTDLNKLYMGVYLNDKGNPTDFLALLSVKMKENVANYDPKQDGVEIEIKIYDRISGGQLTNTTINWVSEY